MAKGSLGKGAKTQIPGTKAQARGKAATGAMPGVPGAPKKVSISKATNVKKGFRVPGRTARGK